MWRALAVVSAPLAALVALGGAYSSSVVPLLIIATFAFLASDAAVAMRGMRTLDVWLAALAGVIALQLVPVPSSILALLSPHARDVQSMLSLEAGSGARALSIDAILTREGLESLAAAILVFWAARATFSRGGTRVVLRALAIAGFAIAVISLAQRATSPNLIWWKWAPLSPRAAPFGPFPNRNHFAAWLLMTIALTSGYTIAHMHSHRVSVASSRRLFLRDVLRDGTTLWLAVSIAIMTITLFATTSRGAILGFFTAAVTGFALSRNHRRSGRAARWAIAALVFVAAFAVWLNFSALSEHLIESGPASRTTIWRETMPIIRDFPATGTGVGTYAKAMLRYQQTPLTLLFNQAHSEYVQLVAEGGMLVTIPVVGAIVVWLSLARRRLSQERLSLRWIRTGACAGLAGLAVQSTWESPIRMTANAMLLAVLAAVVVHEREPSAAGD